MASKSLGTLTLDLVARTGGFVQGMDKAGRESAKWRKQVEKDAKQIGKGIGIAGAAVTAATAAMVVSTVQSANEISRLAQVSNTSADSFQRYAVGAKVVGIEQDKLGEIFKDTNDKLGDFMQTGAGPLADFFEQVAPQIGVTADMFRDLSGPDALQLYVSSLEKANVSQNDMTFYMEAIASDATLLLPLLRDNGAGFKLLGDQAERAGAIMGEGTLSSAEQLSAAMFVMDQTTTGLKNGVMEELLPVLSSLAITFSEVSVEGSLADTVGQALGSTIKGLASTSVGAVAAIHLLGKGIAGLAAITGAATESEWHERIIPPLLAKRIYSNWDEAKTALDVVGSDLDETMQWYGEMLSNIQNAGEDPADGTSQIETIAGFLKEARDMAGQAGGDFRALGKDFDKAGKEAEKSAENIRNQISALDVAAETWGMTAGQVKLYTLEQDGATEADLRRAQSLIEVVENLELSKEAQESYADLLKELRTDEEVLTDQMRERLAVLDAMSGLTDAQRMETTGRIVGAGFEEAPDYAGLDATIGGPAGELDKIDEAQEKLQEWYDTQLSMLDQHRSDRADLAAQWDEQELALKAEHEEQLAEIERARQLTQMAAGEEFFGNMAGAAKAFFGEQSDLYKAAFAIEKSYAVAKALMNVPKSYSDAFAAVVGIPIVGPALAPAAGVAAAAAQVVQAANIGNIGMAHDGMDSIPKTGSWILEKGERVVTQRTSAKLDSTLEQVRRGGMASSSNPIQVINNGPPMNARQEMSGDQIRLILDLAEDRVASSVRGDGKVGKSIQGSFPVKRSGR